MSTEATGGDQTGTANAVGPDAAAEGTGPAAAVAAERETADGSSGDGEPTGEEQAPEPHEPEPSAEEDNPGETADPGEAEELDEAEAAVDAGAEEARAGSEAGTETETEEPDEVAADYEGPEDDQDPEYDEALEYDEGDEDYGGYGGYGPEDDAGPQRARRWLRVLLALGFVVLAAAIVGGAVAIVGSVTHGFKKPVKVTYKKSALFSLKTGECFDPQGQSYSLIPCDSPHDAEVFATFTLSASKWPGAAAVAKEASNGCASRLTGYLNPQLAISLSSTYVYPDSVAWQAGTRTVICEVRATSGQLTGSVRRASSPAG